MRFLAALLLTLPAWAQIDAPLLGYLPDNGRVRPILGIPESAIVAPALDAGPFARIATAAQTVVASLVETGAVLQYRHSAFEPIPGTSASPDLIVLSPSGSTAVLWFASRSTAEIVTHLDATPQVRTVTAPFRPTTPALAIRDDGEWLAGIWPDGVFVIGRDRQPAPIRIDGRPRALAFSASGAQLNVASQTGIYSIADIGGSATVTTIHTASEALQPVAIADEVMADASGSIFGQHPVECHCRPETLAPLIPSVFRLTGLQHGAVLLYDARTGQVLFAPLSLGEATLEATLADTIQVEASK